MARLTCTMARS